MSQYPIQRRVFSQMKCMVNWSYYSVNLFTRVLLGVFGALLWLRQNLELENQHDIPNETCVIDIRCWGTCPVLFGAHAMSAALMLHSKFHSHVPWTSTTCIMALAQPKTHIGWFNDQIWMPVCPSTNLSHCLRTSYCTSVSNHFFIAL